MVKRQTQKVWIGLLILLLLKPLQSTPFRMAFGSCFWHKYIYQDSKIFQSITAYKPEAWVWLGDATYTDTYNFSITKYYIEPDVKVVEQNFNEAKDNEDYKRFREETRAKIYGTWDDHDYGLDNAGKNNPRKELMRKLFLDFLDEAKDSPRRTRPTGINEAYYLDPAKKIKLILLDNRYSKDEENEELAPGEEKSTLGKEQEAWLREEILNSTAYFTVVGAGIQILPVGRDQELFYPSSVKALLTAVNPKTNLVIITGDVHYGEIITDPCTLHTHGYVVKEYTSSGLSHSDGEYPYIGSIPYHLGMFHVDDTYNTVDERYPYRNAGFLDFNIGSSIETSTMEFTLIDREGNKVLHEALDWNHFKHKKQAADWKSYSECKKKQEEMYNKWHTMFYKMTHLKSNSITQLIYLSIGVIILLVYLLYRLARWISSRLCKKQRISDPKKEK